MTMQRPRPRFLAHVVIVAMLLSCIGFSLTRAEAASITTSTSLSLGYDHACAVVQSGDIYCWGRNNYGQLGTNGGDSSTPVVVQGGHSWKDVTAGSGFTCAITMSNDAYCWGRGDFGQLGNGGSSSGAVPVIVSNGLSWSVLSAGKEDACGITTDGIAYCWGANVLGEVGDGSNAQRLVPTAVSGGGTWISISAGNWSACGVKTGGNGYCWGNNEHGQIGDNTVTPSDIPVSIANGLNWTSVDAGSTYACGVADSVGYCWGLNIDGNLGDGSLIERHTPSAIAGGLSISSVSAGYMVTCAVTTTHATYCWGANALGAVGDGTNDSRSAPVLVTPTTLANRVDAGGGGACALSTTSLVYCWGWNAYGTVGNGTTTNTNTVVGVIGLAVAVGDVNVSASVDPMFTFSLGNRASACNGESGFLSGAGSATAIALGQTAPALTVSGGQALTVSTNAGHGFIVYVRGMYPSQNLRSAYHNWTDGGGTYAAPGALGANERFAYTYHDSTASTSVANPGNNLFVALDATNRAVMGSTTSRTGLGCVSFSAQSDLTTPAGLYSATVTYTAVPSF